MHFVLRLDAGGMENGVVNLCNRLDPDRYSPSICVMESGGALEGRVDRGRVGLLTAERRFGNDLRVPLQLARYLRQRGIDILHTHGWATLVEGFLAAKLARVPVVIHGEHGTMETRRRNIVVQRLVWRAVDQVVAVCDPLADMLAHVIGYPKNRIHVIDNGVNTERFQPSSAPKGELRRPLGLLPGGLLIGMVARLIPLKNHAGVLEAIAVLRREGTDVHLALAGDGPLRGELEEIARTLQIAEHVTFLGEIPQVERFLQALDVFVSNSDREGMSNTILEAMACGVPVVATHVGAAGDLLDSGAAGILVPPRDNEALVAALQRLARNLCQRRALGEAARGRAERRFSISSMVASYSRMYAQAVGCTWAFVAATCDGGSPLFRPGNVED